MSYPPPLYDAEAGAASAAFRPADLPHDLAIGVRSKVSYLATGATSGGAFGLYRWDMAAVAPAAGTASAHFHRTFTESFFVLDGTMSLYNGQNWIDASVGDYLLVPPGGIHSFANNSGAPASMLILFAPAPPREAYLEELAEIAAAGQELTHDEWVRLWARHDQYEVPI
jgi:mannose-6-phosphate isomerase-like protein (cupin superfamily)